MPRCPEYTGHSTRHRRHDSQDDYYQERTEQSGSQNYSRGGPSRHSQQSYMHRYNMPYQPGDPRPLVPYCSPMAPNLSNPPRQPDPSVEERNTAWKKQKHRLGDRFEFSGPRYDSSGQDASTVLIPYNEPLPYNSGEEQAASLSHSEPPPAIVDMHSLVGWIGGHAVDYHKSSSVPEVAERVRHNLVDFIRGLSACRAMRDTARREQWGSRWTPQMEDVYYRGLQIESLYATTVARYDGPFKQIVVCSKTEKAEAQELLKLMFGRDYQIWDGFSWHITNWVAHIRQICPQILPFDIID